MNKGILRLLHLNNIDSKVIIDKINKTDSIFETDPLDSELRILDWILFQVCSNKIKQVERL